VAARGLVEVAGDPRVDGRTADSARYQTDGDVGRARGGDGGGKAATEADADGGGFVEVQRIDSGHPGAGFVEHEHAGVRLILRGNDDAAAGHVRLADEEEEMEFFFRWERGRLGAGERGEADESEEDEAKGAHGESEDGVTIRGGRGRREREMGDLRRERVGLRCGLW